MTRFDDGMLQYDLNHFLVKGEKVMRFGWMKVALPCLLLSMLWTSPGLAQRYPVPVGAEHPDFKLPDLANQGKPLSLSDYRGKKVVLLHFASW